MPFEISTQWKEEKKAGGQTTCRCRVDKRRGQRRWKREQMCARHGSERRGWLAQSTAKLWMNRRARPAKVEAEAEATATDTDTATTVGGRPPAEVKAEQRRASSLLSLRHLSLAPPSLQSELIASSHPCCGCARAARQHSTIPLPLTTSVATRKPRSAASEKHIRAQPFGRWLCPLCPFAASQNSILSFFFLFSFPHRAGLKDGQLPERAL